MFRESLEFGKVGESLIAKWMRKRGHAVLPVYEVEQGHGKGPRLFMPDQLLVAPDMLVVSGLNAWWIEAKHKTAFAWNRTRQIWVTGIDRYHFQQYCIVDDSTPWPVWLLFLHRGGEAKDSPPSPSGLYGRSLHHLRKCVNHESDKGGGTSGMVYWAKTDLLQLAEIEEVIDVLDI